MASLISKDVSSYRRNRHSLSRLSTAIVVWDAHCDLGVEADLAVASMPSSVSVRDATGRFKLWTTIHYKEDMCQ
jgi:hypothetical protein